MRNLGANGSVTRAPKLHVGIDQQPVTAAEADPVDLQVFHDALHIVPGFRERNALDPVDWIDVRIARVTEARDPIADAALAGIVTCERQDVRTPIVSDQIAQFGGNLDKFLPPEVRVALEARVKERQTRQ